MPKMLGKEGEEDERRNLALQEMRLHLRRRSLPASDQSGKALYEAEMEALVKIELELSEDLTLLLERSLKPEAETPSTSRARAMVESEGVKLRITIETKDTTALRAAVNSYLRWVEGCLSALEGLQQL
jgi:tRNA threonylcarbamoyladenosine modification (KEOPS) complex  Pcc1 subunit